MLKSPSLQKVKTAEQKFAMVTREILVGHTPFIEKSEGLIGKRLTLIKTELETLEKSSDASKKELKTGIETLKEYAILCLNLLDGQFSCPDKIEIHPAYHEEALTEALRELALEATPTKTLSAAIREYSQSIIDKYLLLLLNQLNPSEKPPLVYLLRKSSLSSDPNHPLFAVTYNQPGHQGLEHTLISQVATQIDDKIVNKWCRMIIKKDSEGSIISIQPSKKKSFNSLRELITDLLGKNATPVLRPKIDIYFNER